MKQIEELRTVEVQQGDEWIQLRSIGQLEPGDVFRMFEPSGEAVADMAGRTLFVCASNAKVEADAKTILDIV